MKVTKARKISSHKSAPNASKRNFNSIYGRKTFDQLRFSTLTKPRDDSWEHQKSFGELNKSFYYSNLTLLILQGVKGWCSQDDLWFFPLFAAMANEVHVYMLDVTASEIWFWLIWLLRFFCENFFQSFVLKFPLHF